ncbi:cell division protein ZapA [Marilutibacter maris]|uniref:Cell division protein ZapA n=1 Tax=Marilutibacter maris TaxID=1605891 RepID=A0A2U9TAM0_9GAMM|nr:cell division protein ZapA [Lysobacter maris]AWV08415.1 cell division ZapA family protein [Lysobacter maris]KAB8198287.1 cell division protein ZapA [Lysobacter maris]
MNTKAHTSTPVSIRVLDREYTVGCEPEERDDLLDAAKLLDGKMREIRGSNRMVALDRVAVLAALNFAHELQQLRTESGRHERELTRTLEDLNRKLDGLLDTPAS